MMIWTVRFAGLGFGLIGAFFGSVGFTVPVAAQVNVAIESITAANTQMAPGHAQALQSALLTSLALAIEKAQKNGCEIKAIDISDEFLRGRQTEIDLQRKGYSQKNGLADGKIIVTDVINGVIGADGDGGLDYVVNVTNLNNNKSVEVTGNAKTSNLVGATDKIAEELVEKLCKKRPYRIVGGSGDPINQVVCTIERPFVLNGRLFGVEFSGGASGTYKFVRTPPGPVRWVANGDYKINFPNGPDQTGKMTATGKGTTTVPGVSKRTDQGAETFTLTPLDSCG